MTTLKHPPLLFTPIQWGDLRLKNRVIVSPMCQYSAVNGNASDWHILHFGRMLLSGAGLFVIEATGVSLDGRISPACLSLASDENEAALARALKIARANSEMPIAIQLAHAGRKASMAVPWQGQGQIAMTAGGWITLAPSADKFSPEDALPHAMDKTDIARVRTAFVEAAKRSARLGLDAIEIHAAHGYLLHQFLSPITNQRKDEYGGSLANRMRLVMEIFESVRAVFPVEKPVGIRLSVSDWVDGGWDVAECILLAHALSQAGCAWIDASSGGLSLTQKITLGPGYQVPFAADLKTALSQNSPGVAVPPAITAVGLIQTVEQAEAILQAGQADVIALARALLWDAGWVWKAAQQLGASVPIPPQYLRGLPR